jgi:hypothetical protein
VTPVAKTVVEQLIHMEVKIVSELLQFYKMVMGLFLTTEICHGQISL